MIVEQVFGIVKGNGPEGNGPERSGGRLNRSIPKVIWSLETFAARFRGWVREGGGSVPSLAHRFRSGQRFAGTSYAEPSQGIVTLVLCSSAPQRAGMLPEQENYPPPLSGVGPHK